MMRLLLWLLGAVVAITFLRGVVGILGRAFGNYVGGTPPPAPSSSRAMLKKCAACGVYAPVHASVKRAGETRHYCSEKCLRAPEAA